MGREQEEMGLSRDLCCEEFWRKSEHFRLEEKHCLQRVVSGEWRVASGERCVVSSKDFVAGTVASGEWRVASGER